MMGWRIRAPLGCCVSQIVRHGAQAYRQVCRDNKVITEPKSPLQTGKHYDEKREKGGMRKKEKVKSPWADVSIPQQHFFLSFSFLFAGARCCNRILSDVWV